MSNVFDDFNSFDDETNEDETIDEFDSDMDVDQDQGVEPEDDTTFEAPGETEYTNLTEDLADIESSQLQSFHGDPSDIIWGDTQSMNGFCAPNAIAGIIETFKGHDIPEADIVGRAAAAGLITPVSENEWSGMTLESTVKLMDMYGIDSHIEVGNIDTLIKHLDVGHKIMLPIDSSEIWYGTDIKDTPDHAIWLVGIDNTDPQNPIAIINDSGDPNGTGREIPLSQLEDAWADSGYKVVVTDEAPDGSQYDFLAFNKDDLENVTKLKGYWFTGPDGESYYKDGLGFVYDKYSNRV